MKSSEILLRNLADILVTPYEELHVTISTDRVCDRDYYMMGDQKLSNETELMEVYGDHAIESMDCFYDGDHIVLEIRLV